MPTPYRAIPCQGFTFTWGTATLQNVQQLEVNYTRGMPTARTTQWSKTPGSVNLIGFSAIGLPNSDYGTSRQLVIECPENTSGAVLTLLNRDCVYTDMTVRAIANDVVQFAYTFMLKDTQGGQLIE